jgi:hypothetical protein
MNLSFYRASGCCGARHRFLEILALALVGLVRWISILRRAPFYLAHPSPLLNAETVNYLNRTRLGHESSTIIILHFHENLIS